MFDFIVLFISQVFPLSLLLLIYIYTKHSCTICDHCLKSKIIIKYNNYKLSCTLITMVYIGLPVSLLQRRYDDSFDAKFGSANAFLVLLFHMFNEIYSSSSYTHV